MIRKLSSLEEEDERARVWTRNVRKGRVVSENFGITTRTSTWFQHRAYSENCSYRFGRKRWKHFRWPALSRIRIVAETCRCMDHELLIRVQLERDSAGAIASRVPDLGYLSSNHDESQ